MSFAFQLTLRQIILGLFLTAASGVLPILLAQAAKAQSVTDNLQIQATVKGSCKINSVTNINFGTYDALGTHYTTPLDSQGSVTVSCLPKVKASIQLKEGLNPAKGSTCTAPARQMKGPSATALLPYGLFQDAARTQTWGCTAATGVGYTAASAAATSFDIYGRIPAANSMLGILDTLEPGAYSDTVQIVVSF